MGGRSSDVLVVRWLTLNALVKSLLLLNSEFVLVDNLELRPKGRILCHVLDESRELRDSFLIEEFLIVNLRQNNDDKLEALIALSKKSNRVLL